MVLELRSRTIGVAWRLPRVCVSQGTAACIIRHIADVFAVLFVFVCLDGTTRDVSPLPARQRCWRTLMFEMVLMFVLPFPDLLQIFGSNHAALAPPFNRMHQCAPLLDCARCASLESILVESHSSFSAHVATM